MIVDDGSKDGSPHIIRQYAEQDSRIHAVTQPNGGVAAARNRGLQESNPQAETLIFLDNDDTLEPDALQVLRDALDRHPEAAAAVGYCRAMDAEGAILNADAPLPGNMVRAADGGVSPCAPGAAITFDVIVCQNPIVSPGMALIRREFLQQAGSWDQAVAPADDWDMWARLTLHGPILALPHAILRYRLHGNNASRQSDKMKQAERAFYRKLMALPQLSAAQKQMARTGAWNHERGLYRGRRRWAQDAILLKNLPLALKHLRHALLHYVRALRIHYRSQV